MKCKYTLQNIDSFLESTFISDEKRLFIEHLDTCQKCKDCYMHLNEIGDILNTSVRLKKDMSSEIMKAIDRSKYKKGSNMFVFKGLFFKYPSFIKVFASITAAMFLIMIITINFDDISYNLSSFKENVIEKLNLQRGFNNDDNIIEDNIDKAIIANNDNESVNTQVEGTAPLLKTINTEKANQIFYSTAIIEETVGRLGPGKEYAEVEKLKYGQVVQIYGWLDNNSGRWYLAKLIPGIEDENAISINTNFSEISEFWVPLNVINPDTQTTAYFDDVFYPGVIAEYKYIVRSPNEKNILLRQLPDEKSSGSCVVGYGNLIAVVKKDAEWSLVKKMNGSSMEEFARVGWIKNSDYSGYAPTMSSIRPTQGFLAKPFEMYSKPGIIADIPKGVIKNSVVPVNVVKWEGEWVYVSSGFNGVVFYVKGTDLKFGFSDQDLVKLANPDIDPVTMLAKLKNDILNWNNIRLVSLDYPEYTVNLTKEQKTVLASKLIEISNIEKFDGGITPSREAEYPFYTLEFLDESGQIKYPENVLKDERGIYDDASYCGYSFVVAGEDRLLVTLQDRLEHYGLNQYSVPIKFIKVNKEFISFIKTITLMTVPPNTDKNSFNYLLNAVKVSFFRPEKNDFNVEGTSPQQVWKTVRRIIEYIDFSTATIASSQAESKLLYEVSFTFQDGLVRKLEITGDYIRYNGYCYKYNNKLERDGMGKPETIIMGLYAAYF